MNVNTYKPGDRDERPWGSWLVYDVLPHAVVKKIEILPGKRISLQRHQHRSERWIVVEGIASVTRDNEHLTVRAGESVMIPRESIHRLANNGSELLLVIEIQYGDYLSEEDIERFTDDYGRAN